MPSPNGNAVVRQALRDARDLLNRVMKEADHGRSAWSAETVHLMNKLPFSLAEAEDIMEDFE